MAREYREAGRERESQMLKPCLTAARGDIDYGMSCWCHDPRDRLRPANARDCTPRKASTPLSTPNANLPADLQTVVECGMSKGASVPAD